MEDAPRSSGLLTKAFAALVLLVAAWILLKIVIGFVSAIFWTVLAIAAVVGVILAVPTIRP